MTDIFPADKRSDVMSRIRSKNTIPEVMVFSYLRKRGVYFQKHYTRVIGSPDIAKPRQKKAVFIDGDFWHGKTFEKRKDSLPVFWVQKIKRNMERDLKYREALIEKGWRILQIWESDIKRKRTRDETLHAIEAFLKK